jgi:hypothetical protein
MEYSLQTSKVLYFGEIPTLRRNYQKQAAEVSDNFLLYIPFYPEDVDDRVHRNLVLSKVDGVTFQKNALLILTSKRT